MNVPRWTRPGRDRSRERRSDPAAVNTAASDEDSLLVAAGRDDDEAFVGLYDLLAPVIHGVVSRVLRDPSQSEEVTQEVFIEVWRLAPRYDPDRGSARAWMNAIAHRRAVDRVRSEESTRRRNDLESREQMLARPSGSENMDRLVDRQLVHQALDSLAPQQRRAIELAYYGGHTYREVANILETPEGTVKSHIREGLSRLRHRLEAT